MAGVAGLEPTNHGVKVRCLATWLYPIIKSVCYTLSFSKNGEPTGIRTPDTRLRRPLLYPTELWTHMERMMRIELTLSAWKAEVLPLNYIRKMERKTRFELATLALARRCSTPEPLPQIGRGRWIRTIESTANGFTVRPLWPLGNPSTMNNWS